jgi:hypothetical protein
MLAQSQTYVCGPCAQPGAQPDPSQSQSADPLSPVVVTAPTLLPTITVTSTYTGSSFNFAALGNALVPYNPGVAAAQFLAIGAGGGTAAAGGVAALPLLRGPALGALMELTGSQINGYAAQSVTSVINTEGYVDALEGLENLGAVFNSLEVPEVAGPDIPW